MTKVKLKEKFTIYLNLINKNHPGPWSQRRTLWCARRVCPWVVSALTTEMIKDTLVLLAKDQAHKSW